MVRGSLGVTSGSITRLTGAVVLVHRQMLAVLGMKNEEEKEKKIRFSMILDTKAKTGNRAIILWFILVKMISSSSSSSSFLPEKCSFEMV